MIRGSGLLRHKNDFGAPRDEVLPEQVSFPVVTPGSWVLLEPPDLRQQVEPRKSWWRRVFARS
ncbi:MAG: hypothetical protein AAGA99_00685 [Actinomycetota bacterium]